MRRRTWSLLLGLAVGILIAAIFYYRMAVMHARFISRGPQVALVGAAAVTVILLLALFRRRRALFFLPAAVALAVAPALTLLARGGYKPLKKYVMQWTLPPGLAPGAGVAVAPSAEEARALAALGQSLDATLVWTSNRDGGRNIYLQRIGHKEIRQLSSHDAPADLHPVWFPDGRHIAFTRLTTATRNKRTSAKIIKMDVETGTEETLTVDGEYPRLSPDGGEMLFYRGKDPISTWIKDLATGAETQLFPEDIQALEGLDAMLASMNRAENRVALTRATTHGEFEVIVCGLDGSNFHKIGLGCRPDWLADGSGVVFVSAEQGIAAAMAPDFAEQVLAPIPEGETVYYPKASNDPRYFTFARGTDVKNGRRFGKEEVYLFDRQTGQQTRLTFHTNSDSFSHIFVKGRARDGK